ncbi:hypothetical protein ACWGCI_02020 [Streptomyces sp. NPDC054949]
MIHDHGLNDGAQGFGVDGGRDGGSLVIGHGLLLVVGGRVGPADALSSDPSSTRI